VQADATSPGLRGSSDAAFDQGAPDAQARASGSTTGFLMRGVRSGGGDASARDRASRAVTRSGRSRRPG
jgi:hypothetical protein